MLTIARSLVVMLVLCGGLRAADWAPVQGKPMTRWAADVSPENVLPEYPRPQLVRDRWQNLNGLWDYAIAPLAEPVIKGRNTDGRGFVPPDAGGAPGAAPTDWQGTILVPFCVESALSGVGKPVGPDNRLWYRRTFSIPDDWQGDRVLLHFGAVDWQAHVWLNGTLLGEHRGGFDPFSFDLTDALKPDGEQELVVAVWDPSNTGVQPCGKQHVRPHGIFYTPVTGIWQTVWIEPVAKTAIRSVVTTSDLAHDALHVAVTLDGPETDLQISAKCSFELREGNDFVRGETGATSVNGREPLKLDIGPNARWSWWTPDHPKMFEIVVEVRDPEANRVVDRVVTTAAMRSIEWKLADDGFNRLFLNGEPVFQYGPLDQGWWPDGLYTAPTDDALKYDIELTKQLGFNMARKHVKVEPARWYHWCDVLGLLVWQDMPSGDRFIGPDDPDITRSEASEAVYRTEWRAIIDSLRPFGCIVAWTPFNEGWGQFKTNEILAWTKELDPTRLVGGPSGWADRGEGDLHDKHDYPGPGMFPATDQRVSVLGEFGGLGLPVDGHTWLDRDNWGYRSFESQEDLGNAYAELLAQMPLLIGRGLAAAVYTQTTDVEVEVNGLVTYDRAVMKFEVDRLVELHRKLHEPPPRVSELSPTSEESPQSWRYTLSAPAEGWQQADFDDSGWESGNGGFGTRGTPGAAIGTEWRTPDIWCRREIELAESPKGDLGLRIHHDEDAEVYLNGRLVASLTGYTTSYKVLVIPGGTEALAAGRNVIAVHCRQTGGGQYIDVGLVDVVPGK
ncbi:MAG: hypothetical protein KF774_11585 [Planctomyces sp.]|nr:hypothetical protein [Planctomyces sp.]